VDDNKSSATALARVLSKQGDQVEAVFDGQAAIDAIHASPPDVVLTDLRMEPVDGMAVLQEARSTRPPCEVIVFTAFGAVDAAVRAMRLGARDFLTKPVTVEQIQARLEQLRAGPVVPSAPPDEDEVISASTASLALLALLKRACDAPSPVWIEGEAGSGRTFVAEILHGLRLKKTGEQLPIVVRDPGLEAPWPETGMVVLPSVDDLPDDLQRGLVRQLALVPPTVRVVATAQPGSLRRVRDGTLRPELYFKLAVLVVNVPPLRERPEDVLPLFDAALRRFSARFQRPVPTIPRPLFEDLARHTWPGNVRELMNAAERAVVMGFEAFQVAPAIRASPDSAGLPDVGEGFSLTDHLEGVEARLLEHALKQTGGDRNKAAKLLGVERNTFRYKLQKYGLLE
jgi:DNA-binding NtrC family response regulator